MTETEGPDCGSDPPSPPHIRFAALRLWRSPPDQPGFARPALLAVTAVTVVAYAWNIGNVTLEPFYGAAARSMSESWHDFIFGAFDPWGTVTVDKLPGALWVQALSLRLFGFHLWAVALPQVIEGGLTVLVLYRAVRRVGGPGAGLVAALALAVSPVTVLLNRGNISDSLLILLLVLAADATTKACTTGRPASLALAGVWVGLAFQAKMAQAWLVLPALFGVYLIAAPTATFLRRLSHVALSALVVVVVSLSWMTAVSAVPAHDRPVVDGSCDNSVFSQVFVYNGLDRFGATKLHQPGCSPPSHFFVEAAKLGAALDLGTAALPAGWDRLLRGPFGRDVDWLVLPAVASAAGLFVLLRRRPRTDPLRAAALLWSGWLVLTWAFFSGGRYLNSYYLAALIPALAALCGLGAAAAWRHRRRARARLVVLLTVASSAAWTITLVPGNAGVRPWIIGWLAVVAALAVGVVAGSLHPHHGSVWANSVGLTLSTVALLSGSAWASGLVLASGEGPFDTPYQPALVTVISQVDPARRRAVDWPELARYANQIPRTQAADVLESSYLASTDIFATGREFLSVGGYSGQIPAPPLPQFIRDVAQGKVVLATASVAPRSHNPDMIWVIAHCAKEDAPSARFRNLGTVMQRYICSATARRAVGAPKAAK
jgi:4-amino-4-deoxy-L-arabinose transferase-like glycosyltransferase